MARPRDQPPSLTLRCAAYAVLRQGDGRLPRLRLPETGGSAAGDRLARCFAAARERLADAPPEAALFDATALPERMSASEARRLQAEVIRVEAALAADPAADPLGSRFEAASSHRARKAQGQHFTPPPVVELVLALARADAADNVMDPTCGTGAFLTRAATRAPRAELWGCELDPLAATLARINLRRRTGTRAGHVQGHVHTGDVLTLLPGADVQGAALPACDAVVGNLPYVRLHRQAVSRWRSVLGQRWAARDGSFVTGGRPGRPELRLSGHADLYALLFFHLVDLVAPGGRLALLTANAYLDAGYGQLLEQLFVRHFHLVAVVESRCEPWFADASVNTVITVLERPAAADSAPRRARFVQLTRPLLDGTDGRKTADPGALAAAIDSAVGSPVASAVGSPAGSAETRDDDHLPYETVEARGCRIRLVDPTVLEEGSDANASGDPWSSYLRAPDLYFRLRRHPALRPAGSLLTIRRGVTTNWNPFFYPTPEAAAQVEDDYLIPVVRSPRVSRTIGVEVAGLTDRLFVCQASPAELERAGHRGALGWIAQGRRMTNRQGRALPEALKGHPWYRVDPTPCRLLLTKTTHDTHLHRLLDRPAAVDQRLYGVTPADPRDTELVAALLNSSVVALMTEVMGSASLGDGALDLPVRTARRLQMPDPAALSSASRRAILRAFEALRHRPVAPLWQEVERPDRQALDRAVLGALDLDLDPDRLLPQLYDGLCGLTRQRLALAQRRRGLKA